MMYMTYCPTMRVPHRQAVGRRLLLRICRLDARKSKVVTEDTEYTAVYNAYDLL